MHILLLDSSLFLLPPPSAFRSSLCFHLLYSTRYHHSSPPFTDRLATRPILLAFSSLSSFVHSVCVVRLPRRITLYRIPLPGLSPRVILNIADRTMARFNRTERSANVSPQLFIASRCLTQRNAITLVAGPTNGAAIRIRSKYRSISNRMAMDRCNDSSTIQFSLVRLKGNTTRESTPSGSVEFFLS